MGALVNLAERILEHARRTEEQLQQTGAPEPSFDADAPMSYPMAPPELVEVRYALVQAAQDMTILALGPSELVRCVFLNDRSKLAVLKLISHFRVPQTVPVGGDVSYHDLAEKLHVDEALLTRVLRYAMTHGMFRELGGTSVTHNGVSMALRKYDKLFELQTSDLTVLSLLKLNRVLETWNQGDDERSKQRGIDYAFGKASDMWNIIKAEEHDTKGPAWFSETMRSWSESQGKAVYLTLAGAIDWKSFTTGPIVDLGGGNGHVSIELAKRFSAPTFLVQDLDVSEAAEDLPAELSSRVSYHIQDAFRPQPDSLKPSAYILKSVLHDWPDQDCAKILRNLVPKMELYGAKIIIMERWMPAGDEDMSGPIEANIRHADLLMFSLFGSSERTIQQWTAVFELADSRLKIEEVVKTGGSEWVVIQLMLDDN